MSFSCFFVVALRTNTVTVIIGLILLVTIFIKNKLKVVLLIIIIFSTFLGLNFSKLFVEKQYNTVSLGMMWELIGIAKTTDNKKLISEINNFGDFDEASLRYNTNYCNALFWDSTPPFPVWRIAEKNVAYEISKLYVKTFFNQPFDFIKNKINFANKALGFTDPLIDARRGIHSVDVLTISFGAIETYKSNITRGIFINFTNRFSFLTRRPLVLFIITGLILFLHYLLIRTLPKKEVIVMVLSMFYYVAFLLNTQAHEFRYFAPAFFILTIIVFSSLCSILFSLVNKIKNKIYIILRSDKLKTAKLTDKNWKNGVLRTGNTLLFDNSIRNFNQLKGSTALKAKGVISKIISIDHDSEWIRVVTDGNKEVFAYPTIIEVIK